MRIVNYAQALELCEAWPVDSIQALGFELNTNKPLVCDGKAGPKTRTGYYVVPTEGDPRLVQEMLRFVKLGVQEDGGNNKGWGPAAMYGECKVEDCDPDEWDEIRQGAWCAATVSRAILNLGLLGFKLVGGARKLTDFLQSHFGASKKVVGAVVSWVIPRPKVPYGGHVGVICHQGQDGSWYVIEGNGSARHGRVRVYRYEADLKYGDHEIHKIAACPI
jgi:hypothetical protein